MTFTYHLIVIYMSPLMICCDIMIIKVIWLWISKESEAPRLLENDLEPALKRTPPERIFAEKKPKSTDFVHTTLLKWVSPVHFCSYTKKNVQYRRKTLGATPHSRAERRPLPPSGEGGRGLGPGKREGIRGKMYSRARAPLYNISILLN